MQEELHSVLLNKADKTGYASVIKDAEEYFGVAERAIASRYNTYRDLTPGISSRPGLTRSDYDSFRPDEAVQRKHREMLRFAQTVYKNNGLIREIIDLMGDFAVQGIRVSSADKREERFYRAWFAKVNGPERSERFLNLLYRLANVVIRKQTATISRTQRAQLFKAGAKSDLKIEDTPVKPAEIPWRYIFLDPCTIELIGEELGIMSGDKQYAIHFPKSLASKITAVNTGISLEEKKVIKNLPPEIVNAIKTNGYYPLPQNKTLVYHYKKDDWEAWATPIVHAIADDIILLEKLKLADITALDGAISNIRIFKLGSLDPLIVPARGAATKLKNALSSSTGGTTIDIVWDAAIELVESKSEVYKFLGKEKYEPTLQSIYGGLGVPATLTGSASGGTGTTNNLISLQTLVQRLEYGRTVLLEFWNSELAIVREAMGFTTKAKIEFDYMELGDAASTKRLLIDLSDRGLISDELLKEKFKHDSELEDARINTENKQRGTDRPLKAGPFYDGQPEEGIKKLAVQKGYLTPEQVGVSMEKLGKQIQEMDKTKTGVPGQGRPKNAKDQVKRKQKRFVPKSKASLDLWISDAQSKITEVLNPAILTQFGRKNMRALTAKESKMAENIKFGVLLNMEPFGELNPKNIQEACLKPISSEAQTAYNEMCLNTSSDLGRELTYDDVRHIQRHIYESYC